MLLEFIMLLKRIEQAGLTLVNWFYELFALDDMLKLHEDTVMREYQEDALLDILKDLKFQMGDQEVPFNVPLLSSCINESSGNLKRIIRHFAMLPEIWIGKCEKCNCRTVLSNYRPRLCRWDLRIHFEREREEKKERKGFAKLFMFCKS